MGWSCDKFHFQKRLGNVLNSPIYLSGKCHMTKWQLTVKKRIWLCILLILHGQHCNKKLNSPFTYSCLKVFLTLFNTAIIWSTLQMVTTLLKMLIVSGLCIVHYASMIYLLWLVLPFNTLHNCETWQKTSAFWKYH